MIARSKLHWMCRINSMFDCKSIRMVLQSLILILTRSLGGVNGKNVRQMVSFFTFVLFNNFTNTKNSDDSASICYVFHFFVSTFIRTNMNKVFHHIILKELTNQCLMMLIVTWNMQNITHYYLCLYLFECQLTHHHVDHKQK